MNRMPNDEEEQDRMDLVGLWYPIEILDYTLTVLGTSYVCNAKFHQVRHHWQSLIRWLLLMKGELFLAPVQKPQRILDLGTGTGIWAIDIAE